MKSFEVSGAVRPIYASLAVKRLMNLSLSVKYHPEMWIFLAPVQNATP